MSAIAHRSGLEEGSFLGSLVRAERTLYSQERVKDARASDCGVGLRGFLPLVSRGAPAVMSSVSSPRPSRGRLPVGLHQCNLQVEGAAL